MLRVKFKRLNSRAVMPKYATPGAACFDLHAVADNNHFVCQSCPTVVRTGLAVEVPQGHVMLIFGRSGLAFKHDLRLANCVGVIDSDYRGELLVKLTSDDVNDLAFKITDGARIAQAMIVALPTVALEEAEDLSVTARGAGGFGSTGV